MTPSSACATMGRASIPPTSRGSSSRSSRAAAAGPVSGCPSCKESWTSTVAPCMQEITKAAEQSSGSICRCIIGIPGRRVAQRILIVDDEDLIVLAMRKYFEGLGYLVDSAFELEEAQAMLANYEYDLVIADLRLTGIGGVEGLQIVSG